MKKRATITGDMLKFTRCAFTPPIEVLTGDIVHIAYGEKGMTATLVRNKKVIRRAKGLPEMSMKTAG